MKRRKGLRALVEFLPALEKPEFQGGEWVTPEVIPGGVGQMGYATLDDVASAFVCAAGENGWVMGNFDWPAWAATAEAERLWRDDDALATATADQLAKLLTVCIRQDRFCEGALLGAFESGLILRIVRRADALLRAQAAD